MRAAPVLASALAAAAGCGLDRGNCTDCIDYPGLELEGAEHRTMNPYPVAIGGTQLLQVNNWGLGWEANDDPITASSSAANLVRITDFGPSWITVTGVAPGEAEIEAVTERDDESGTILIAASPISAVRAAPVQRGRFTTTAPVVFLREDRDRGARVDYALLGPFGDHVIDAGAHAVGHDPVDSQSTAFDLDAAPGLHLVLVRAGGVDHELTVEIVDSVDAIAGQLHDGGEACFAPFHRDRLVSIAWPAWSYTVTGPAHTSDTTATDGCVTVTRDGPGRVTVSAQIINTAVFIQAMGTVTLP